MSKQEVTAQCPSSAHGLTYAHAARMGDEWVADLKSGDVTEEFKCQPYAKTHTEVLNGGGCICEGFDRTLDSFSQAAYF